MFELGDGDLAVPMGTAYNPNETVYGSRWDDDIVGDTDYLHHMQELTVLMEQVVLTL